MKVFVSWSGRLSRETADILRELLPCMLQGLDVFVSRHDIHSGTRWGVELAHELETTSFGILCLTATNQAAPWLLYEAGALTKQLESKACGLLLGELTPANVSGPLAQFQHRRLVQDEFLKLVQDLNASMKTPLESDQVRLIFNKWWPDVDARYRLAQESVSAGAREPHPRSDRELLEEIIEQLRAVRIPRPVLDADSMIQTAKAALELVVEQLPDSQRQLLGRIAACKASNAIAPLEEIARVNCVEIDALAKHGLLRVDEEGVIRINRFLSRVVLVETE